MRYKSFLKYGLATLTLTAGLFGGILQNSSQVNAAEVYEASEVTYAEEVLVSGEEEIFASQSNAHHQDYTNVGRVSRKIYSYLIPGTNGFTRVEYVGDKLLIENYNSNFQRINGSLTSLALPVFGGFYEGSDAYYVVTGQENTEEDNAKEVIRITKYSKTWQNLGSASLYGANTTIPFDASCLRMCENGDYLFIRTGHEMYTTSDGLNHQANLSIMLNTNTMKIVDSFTKIWNLENGYVSHSFNQFIQVADGKVYAVDHGDAGFTRCIVLGRYSNLDISSSYSAINIFDIQDAVKFHYNDTGVAVGGFEISDTHCLVAGCSVVQDANWESATVRNIWLSAVPTDNFSSTAAELTWITDYEEGGDISVTNPHLVKIDADNYVLLWETTEEESFHSYYYSYLGKVQYVMLDGKGNVTSDIMTIDGQLSDCKPVVMNNQLVWYVSNNNTMASFYKFDIVYNGAKASLKLDEITPDGVSISNSTLTLYRGKAHTLTAELSPVYTTMNAEITWSSSDTSVATVKNGVVTAVGVGTATITAYADGYTASCTVTVPEVPVSGVYFTYYSNRVRLGGTVNFSADYYPKNTTEDTTFIWSSSNPKVATVKDGEITALSAGTTTISLTVGSKTVTQELQVYEVPITDICLDYINFYMDAGQTKQFSAYIYPTNTTDDTSKVIWSSSDTSVATVKDGLVTAVSAGTATISATIGSVSGTCNVTVHGSSTIPTPTPDVNVTPAPGGDATVMPTPAPGDTAANVEAFVERMYTVVLNRTADPVGMRDWTGWLLDHTVDGAAIAQGFILSDEFLAKNVSNEEYMNILYRTFFNREADAEGRATWMALLENGTSRNSVLAGFVNSNEFDKLCTEYGIIRGTMAEDGGFSTGTGINGFVERLYSKVLGRASDANGIATWVGVISDGTMSAEEVSKKFFFSEEYLLKNTSDGEFVKTLYQTFMNRAADADGQAFWLSYLTGGADRTEVLEGFSRSVEFAEILKSYGLQ